MTRINSGDYPPRGNYKRRKAIQQTAEELAAIGGGEVEYYVEEAERIFAHEDHAYKDDALIGQGFGLPTIYKYTDAQGALLYESLRYQHTTVKSAKEFRQRRRAPPGTGVAWLADAGLIKVPYNWPAIVARPNETVFWTEGEKDADRLMGLGLLATTAAGQGWSIHITKALAGRDVVVLVDNDDKGRQNAEQAVDNLRGWATTRTVALPGLGPTEDVSDWLDAGHTVEELRTIVEFHEDQRRTCDANALDRPENDPAKMLALPAALHPPVYWSAHLDGRHRKVFADHLGSAGHGQRQTVVGCHAEGTGAARLVLERRRPA